MTQTDRTQEWRDFLAQNPDLEAVQLFITDPSGVARGKTASVSELERLYTNGRPVAGSILGLDITRCRCDGSRVGHGRCRSTLSSRAGNLDARAVAREADRPSDAVDV